MEKTASDHIPSPPSRQPAPLGLWRRLHAAIGQEMFGRPAGPWGALFAPVPLVGLGLVSARLALPGGWLPPWAWHRVGEIGWLLLMPFVLATVGQAIAQARSEWHWAASRGQHHLDWSPRLWHYQAAAAASALPLVAMQLSPGFLEGVLIATARLQAWLAPQGAHVGYNPGAANLLALLALGLVFGQAQRLLETVPPGRLLGLQRELARLRGAVAWEPEAWEALVQDAFDRWLADVSPAASAASPSGERQRQRRVRWAGLRKEAVASFVATPPELKRANRALLLYRQGK